MKKLSSGLCSTLALSLLLASGCAAMQKAYENQVCNENGGYERGMNDARAGKPMDQAFSQSCAETSRASAQTGYHKGYTSGLKSMEPGNPRTQMEPGNVGTQINVNIGSEVSAGSSKKHYCEVKAFTKTFSAWGATQLEAKVNAMKNCTAEYHEMHCDEVECKQ